MTPYTEALSKEQVRALKKLGPAAGNLSFYLAGGTALAMLLGHRRSEDFDWFTQERIDDPMVLAAKLRANKVPLDVDETARGTLHGSVLGVRTSFFEYRYPPLMPFLPFEKLGFGMASLVDIGCMKLSAIAQRGSRKDFVDLYALGRFGLSLGALLSFYQKKFGVKDAGYVLFALASFDEAEREPMPDMLWDVSWNSIKRAIRSWVRQAAS